MFDVDGTLTPSRGRIDTEFHDWFLDFCLNNSVYIVTGSDKSKTIEQIGSDIYSACIKVYNCSGNEVWQGNRLVYQNNWSLPDEVRAWLTNELESSPYLSRTGNHMEERTGMINFSIVGRNAGPEHRADYFKYDCITQERKSIATKLVKQFPGLLAKVGGETGIDIFPLGCDKSQVLNDFNDISSIIFFGDSCEPSGNDYPIAELLNPYQTHHVKDWHQTWDLLKNR